MLNGHKWWHKVARTGSYNDLKDIPSVTVLMDDNNKLNTVNATKTVSNISNYRYLILCFGYMNNTGSGSEIVNCMTIPSSLAITGQYFRLQRGDNYYDIYFTSSTEVKVLRFINADYGLRIIYGIK